MDNTAAQEKLLERIRTRRAEIKNYVNEVEPRGSRLTTLSIVLSAVATALTAGPALGGESFTEAVQKLFGIVSDEPVWRILCLAATLLSIGTVISTNLVKTNDTSARLGKAQAASALLSGLETMLEIGQVSPNDGARLYQQYILDVAFIPEGGSSK